MKLETVGHLRALLTENNNKIELGKLKISCKEGGDIDFHMDGYFCMWFSELEPDITPLSDESKISIVTGYFDRNKALEDQNEELQKELVVLRAELKSIKGNNEMVDINKGKVEAYENLLLGRQVTIGK